MCQPGGPGGEEVRRKEARQDAQAPSIGTNQLVVAQESRELDGGGARTLTQLRQTAGHGLAYAMRLELQKAYAFGSAPADTKIESGCALPSVPDAYAFCSSSAWHTPAP